MRRNFFALTVAGLLGSLFLAGDASACHKHKKAEACPAPAPVAYCAPAPVPVAYCAPAPKKTCHMKMPKIKMGHHKAAACAPTTYAAAPVYSAPMASPQASGQGM